jgi:hypothetical protein
MSISAGPATRRARCRNVSGSPLTRAARSPQGGGAAFLFVRRHRAAGLRARCEALDVIGQSTPISETLLRMRLSSMADYAVVTMSAAARLAGARGSVPPSSRETGLCPPRRSRKLVSKAECSWGSCARARGAGGGLKLARAGRRDHPSRTFRGVEGPTPLTGLCRPGPATDASLEGAARSGPHWVRESTKRARCLAGWPLTRLAGAVFA